MKFISHQWFVLCSGFCSVVWKKLGFLVLLVLVQTGCSPKIYLIDRQTVLEDEAAGEWPEFEKELLQKSRSEGPVPFPKTEVSERNRRLYQILNGELASQSPSLPKTKKSSNYSDPDIHFGDVSQKNGLGDLDLDSGAPKTFSGKL